MSVLKNFPTYFRSLCGFGLFGYFSLAYLSSCLSPSRREMGWSGGAMVLGKLSVPGRPIIRMIVGQGSIALAVGAGWGLFGHFYSPLSFPSSFSLSQGDGPI